MRLSLVLLVAISVSCGTADGADNSATFETQFQEAARLYELERPLFDDFMFECMSAQGFDYTETGKVLGDKSGEVNKASIGTSLALPAMIPKSEEERVGYGLVDNLLYIRALLEQDVDVDEPLSPEYIAAYSGDFKDPEDEGCLGEAFQKFDAISGLGELARSLESHSGGIVDALNASPEFEEWRRCMAEQGYNFDSVADVGQIIQSEIEMGMESGSLHLDDVRPLSGNKIEVSGDSSAFVGSLRSLEVKLSEADYECDSGGALRTLAADELDSLADHFTDDHS